jgi:lipopolysaccharide biosynthesis protein
MRDLIRLAKKIARPLKSRLAGSGRVAMALGREFDSVWYREKYLIREYSKEPLEHYLKEGIRLGYSPNGWFDEKFYLAFYPDVAKACTEGNILCGFQHYLEAGRRENRVPRYELQSGTALGREFDPVWYREKYLTHDYSKEPLQHYLMEGMRLGYSPNRWFDEKFYLAFYSDVAKACKEGTILCGFQHYLVAGRRENRITRHEQQRRLEAPMPGVTRPLTLGRLLGSRIPGYLSRALATARFCYLRLRNLPTSLESYKEAYLAQAACAVGSHSPHYGARRAKPPPTERCDVQLIAYYLPQYHPIPENDRWWGAGHTEWRSVARAFPVFAGHYQPRLPGELGFYDLRIPDVMRQQIQLAKLHGISAFCFHFYWFGGKRLLELPIENFLQNSELDFKFCLCWANENWTRRWDGADNELLIAQSHSAQDDIAFIRYLNRYFDDPRYLRIHGKPVLTVYRPDILPDAKATVARWRGEAERAGLPGLFLVATNSFGFSQYEGYGFDALSEFPPHETRSPEENNLVLLHPDYRGTVYSYAGILESIKATSNRGDSTRRETIFPGVMPCWDNTPRRPLGGNVFHGSTPALFYEWLMHSIARAKRNAEDERMVFINAWNEWSECAYLEPDRWFGYGYLAACAAAVTDDVKVDSRVAALFKQQRESFRANHRRAVAIHLYYEDLATWFAERVADFGDVDVYLTVPRTIDWNTAQAVRDSFGQAYILEVDNRGKDIRPFLTVYSRFLEGNYDFVCKLHSKKSLHLTDGGQWRENMMCQLLGPAARDALNTYQSKSLVGILAPRGSLESLADPSIRLRSEKNLLTLAARLDYKMTFRELFVAGSMFWFRPAALQNLHQLFVQGLEFEPELGQVDGAMAHAIERIVCIAAKAAGMSTREYGETPITRPSIWR